ncbi:MAG: dephospho-CoA kinase [Nitrospirota bacterium]
MPVIGLTGNFGMGKSTVLKLFNKLGAHTFSADEFVHNILENPVIIRKIARVLGRDILKIDKGNISIDKECAADIIFNNPDKRKAVERIIHPEVLKLFKKAVSGILKKKSSAMIVFEVPLLFEAGYAAHFNKTIVVYCSRDTALMRLTQKGFSRNEAVKRMRAQMPITKKKRLADFLIDNNKNRSVTGLQIRKIYKELSAPARS